MLSNQFNKTYSQTQRSIHASNLYTVRPHPGEKIGPFCERLQQYRDPVEGTKEEISDNVMIHYLLNFAGVRFSEATHMLRKELNKGTLTLQETIDELCEYERNKLSHEINGPNNNISGALLYPHGGGKNLFCQYCKKKGHHISDCPGKKRSRDKHRVLALLGNWPHGEGLPSQENNGRVQSHPESEALWQKRKSHGGKR